MTNKNALAGQGFAQPENSSDDISVIKFEAAKVRIVKINGEPWFVAKDVCAALELSNSRMALQALDDDERNTVTLTYGIRGNPNHIAVSESGFYKLIARSRKAITPGTFAHRFSNWVFREVNGAVIKSVSNLVKAINRNLQQIIAVRTWYANLVFGSNDDPRDVAPRVSGLANLSEYIDGMEKINSRQGKADDEDGKQAA